MRARCPCSQEDNDPGKPVVSGSPRSRPELRAQSGSPMRDGPAGAPDRAQRGPTPPPTQSRPIPQHGACVPMNLEPMARDLGALLKERGETVAVSESSTAASSPPPSSRSPVRRPTSSAAPWSTPARRGTGCSRSRPSCRPRRGRHRNPTHSSERGRSASASGRRGGSRRPGRRGRPATATATRAGHTCLAVSGPVERVLTLETGHGDREANMWEFARAALALLHEALRRA